jgi:hypothetical protein
VQAQEENGKEKISRRDLSPRIHAAALVLPLDFTFVPRRAQRPFHSSTNLFCTNTRSLIEKSETSTHLAMSVEICGPREKESAECGLEFRDESDRES